MIYRISFLCLLYVTTLWGGEQRKILPAWQTEEELKQQKTPVKGVKGDTPPEGKLYLPAEFAKMEGVLIQPSLYDSETMIYFTNLVRGVYLSGAKPYLLVRSESEKDEVLFALRRVRIGSSHVKFIIKNYDAFWTRDYGPWHTYLDGERIIVDMKYYSTRPNDDAIPLVLGSLWSEETYKTDLYTEGGNFMSDGFGTCWASTGVLERNPHLTRTTIENIYLNYMGCDTITFVEPVPGEGTTHIDMFSKILNQDTIMVGYSNSSLGATQGEIDHLERAAEIYRNSPKPDGGAWNIVRIPMNFRNVSGAGRVYYTHTNSLVVNNYALVPTYGLESDSEALQIYRDALPEYTVMGIDSNATIPWGGAIHCTTMQIPVKTELTCGNGVVNEGESCETNYFNGKTCADFGYTGGVLKCSECGFDFSECTGCVATGDELCDGLDNDCDGTIDNDLTAPQAGNQTGICSGSVQICDGANGWIEPDYTTITGYEAVEISCDGADNDCDGAIDEDLTAPAATLQGGVCAGTIQTCGGVNGWEDPDFTKIDGYEVSEVSCDGVDNDCDGAIDNNLATPAGENQKGICSGSVQVCDGVNGWVEPDYSVISGYETTESSCDGLDNDCDGTIDNSLTASNASKQQGVCAGSKEVCGGENGWLEPDYTLIATYEATETSCDGLDNDCDGAVDEELTAPEATLNKGVCRGSVQSCGGVDGWVEPDYTAITGYEVAETSCDGVDNDCDGAIDNELEAPKGRLTAGVCANITQICDGAEGWKEPDYTAVTGYESEETLCDGVDNDCDGEIDEGCDSGSDSSGCHYSGNSAAPWFLLLLMGLLFMKRSLLLMKR